MHTVSYHRHGFPPDIIQNAVRLYFRFPLSFRDVEDLLAERGIDVSYETVRRWSVKFGLAYARRLRRSHPPADTGGHLDEVSLADLPHGRAAETASNSSHALSRQQKMQTPIAEACGERAASARMRSRTAASSGGRLR